MKKRIFGLILAFVIITAFVPCVTAAEIVDGGNCGPYSTDILGYSPDLKWTLDSEGTVVISGKGKMEDYHNFSNKSPFEENLNVKKVIIEDGVTNIGSSAFRVCRNLTDIVIADSVTEIGASAFWNCSSIVSITLPNGIEKINSNVFLGCDKLQNIEVSPENNNYSSDNGILFSKDKTELICYPNGKKESKYTVDAVRICDASFIGNKYLKSVIISDNTVSIGQSAFDACESLRNVEISDSVIELGESAFSNCTNLTTVDLPVNLTELSGGLFAYSGLRTLSIPRTVRKIGNILAGFPISDIYYRGTEKEWNEIDFWDKNEIEENAIIHYNADKVPIVSLNNMSVTDNKDGTYTLEYSESTIPCRCSMLVALYSNDGVLTGCASDKLNNTDKAGKITVKADRADKAVVLLWDSFDETIRDMRPLCNAVSVSIISN